MGLKGTTINTKGTKWELCQKVPIRKGSHAYQGLGDEGYVPHPPADHRAGEGEGSPADGSVTRTRAWPRTIGDPPLQDEPAHPLAFRILQLRKTGLPHSRGSTLEASAINQTGGLEGMGLTSFNTCLL